MILLSIATLTALSSLITQSFWTAILSLSLLAAVIIKFLVKDNFILSKLVLGYASSEIFIMGAVSPFFLLAYHDNIQLANQNFNHRYLDSYNFTVPLMAVSAVSYICGFIAPFRIFGSAKRQLNSTIGIDYCKSQILNVFTRRTLFADFFISAVLCILLFTSFKSIENGCIGSLASFTENTQCQNLLLINISRQSFTILSLILAFQFIALNKSKKAHFLDLFRIFPLILVLILAFVVGDRRYIIYPLLSILSFAILFYKFRWSSFFLSSLLLLCILALSEPFSVFLGSVAASGDSVDYFQSSKDSLLIFLKSPWHYLQNAMFIIVSAFDFHYIYAAAGNAKDVINPPFCYPLFSSIYTFVVRILDVPALETACDAESILFKYSLIRANLAPYLVSPASAENFFYGGIILTSFDLFLRGLIASFVSNQLATRNMTLFIFFLANIYDLTLFSNSWNQLLFRLVLSLFVCSFCCFCFRISGRVKISIAND
jgi:hypothetical protein